MNLCCSRLRSTESGRGVGRCVFVCKRVEFIVLYHQVAGPRGQYPTSCQNRRQQCETRQFNGRFTATPPAGTTPVRRPVPPPPCPRPRPGSVPHHHPPAGRECRGPHGHDPALDRPGQSRRGRTRSMNCHVSRRACGSRPVVQGKCDSRCFCPPEVASGELGTVERCDEFRDVGPTGVEGGVQRERLADLDRGRQGAALELDADPLPDAVALRARMEAEHPDPAGVRRAEPRDALHERGPPGAVGAQDAEDLARLHGQAHVVDGDHRPAGLLDPLDLDDGHIA